MVLYSLSGVIQVSGSLNTQIKKNIMYTHFKDEIFTITAELKALE